MSENYSHAHRRPVDSIALGLGVFSITLGLAELLMPKKLAKGVGMRGQENLLRAYGVREIATGIGILSSENHAPWIWGRVGGDALDIATLGLNAKGNSRKGGLAVALAAVLGVTLVDLACAQTLSSKQKRKRGVQWDYSNRSGFPRRPEEMRGIAQAHAQAPHAVRTQVDFQPAQSISP